MSEKEKVEGYVEHIIFRNEENGYTVLNLSMKGRELTCVGTLPMIGEVSRFRCDQRSRCGAGGKNCAPLR